MSFEFYALPDELQPWLASIIIQDGIWCLKRRIGNGVHYDLIRDARDVKAISFMVENEDDVILFIGRSDLSPIVLENKAHSTSLDFIRSQAIQFVPSTIAKEVILLEGRLAIMRPSEYKLHGIDPKPLSQWYRHIQKSLASIMTRDNIVVQRTSTGKLKEWREIGITQGAVSWRRNGRLLKQFPRGEVEFDVTNP